MSQSVFLVPLTNVPQQFQIALAGATYIIICKWNDADDAGWVIDISDQNENPIACNIPLITGADCLSGLEYLGIDGNLYVSSSGSSQLELHPL